MSSSRQKTIICTRNYIKKTLRKDFLSNDPSLYFNPVFYILVTDNHGQKE